MTQIQTQFKTIGDYRDEYTLKPIKNKKSISSHVIKRFGAKSPEALSGEKKPGKFKDIIGKLSRGLMLPIAMLPIAGLFLGIGSALLTQGQNNHIEWLEIFGRILKVPGDAIFGNLALLFAVAIAITFTNDKGVSGLAAFVGWVAFCAMQSALITTKTNDAGQIISADILFYHFQDGAPIWTTGVFNAIVTNNIGIQSLQTSVFGGITVGALTAVLYNRFRNIQLPQSLGFFSGVRFIPIITFLLSLVGGLLFCIIWPIFGLGLYKFGIVAGTLPFGINSFIFGFAERVLVPTGLHHAFYMPLWQTAAGGQMVLDQPMVINGLKVIVDGKSITWQQFAGTAQNLISGDQNCWVFINSIAGRIVGLENGTVVKLTFENIANSFPGVNPGQYLQGKFPFMLFALPAAAFGIVMAAPKGNGRNVAMSTVMGSALTCFLTGITEPLEFTFLFLAPALFFGFHAVGCAISFWLMNLLGGHCGLSFSGGFIDFCIYGVLPDAMGAQARCWLAPIIGLPLAVIYFFGFWKIIKRFDIKTPGREGAENKLYTKADYKNKNAKADKAAVLMTEGVDASKFDDQEKFAYEVILAYGGKANITNVEACITKLRVEVVSASKVDFAKLKKLGARGVMKISSTAVYAVFGTKADLIKNSINDLLPKIGEAPHKLN